MTEWQQMETAPKDGTYILAYRMHDPYPDAVAWSSLLDRWRTRYENFWITPAGWMPLPAVPLKEMK